MRMNYIAKIQSNLKGNRVIQTKKATSRLLDGSYYSIYKGRSMNFDELREYVAGDEVKDIDWKASSRSQKLLVRQYIAEKKHNIMIVLDTGKRMLADTREGQEKREVALMCAGTMAYLINKNGDYISGIYANEKLVSYFPFKTGLFNIENILANYHTRVTYSNESNINIPLSYITKNFRKRMIIVIFTDREGVRTMSETALKKLLIMNDILLVNIGDAVKSGQKVYDVIDNTYLPDYFTEDKKLADIEKENISRVEAECREKLKRLGISSVTINHTNQIEEKLIELFGKHKGEKKANGNLS